MSFSFSCVDICVWCNVFIFSCVDILCLVVMSLVLVVLISCVWFNVFSFSCVDILCLV